MKKTIVIIGGGFAGINVALQLAKKDGFHVILVDRNNYNFFPPLLYQVATGFLEVSNISYPFRKLFQKYDNVNFRLGELQKIVPEANKVILTTGELSYDYLVIATGTESNYFGIENIKKYGTPMKTLNDATNMRNFLLLKMEEATIETDEIEKKKLTTIVIAGGGPTGVEIAGMLSEMRKNIFRKDYPELAGYKGAIYLVDGGPKVLAPMSEKAQKYTFDTLVKLGVNVKLNKQVKDYVNDTVIFADGETIQTKILIWAAGVTATVFEGIPATSYGRGKRLLVDEFNKVAGTTNIFAIGDTCFQTTDKNFPNGHPQVAQVAIQQGKNLAKNFLRTERNESLVPFVYTDKGSMAIIGTTKAVADLPKPELHFTGFIAWFMWLFIHLVSLINYRNQLRTLYNWVAAFLTKDQSLRMIIRPASKHTEDAKTPTVLVPDAK
ncbi:NAD(P)/FAD-dependent oxidoreductase [Segetibacter koreensis]|uniref:NAD(P)/FAD-dependent oxidoreductase n=1 Tax=Segetibacter koreensis TaxID=398037 RepID=UPI00036C4118|nr:NAD(P)/FAD-dependent oxidoreductase [Segetibacter koreensis]